MTTTTISTTTTSQVVLTSNGTLDVTSSGAISFSSTRFAVTAPNGFAAITNSGLIENLDPNSDGNGIQSTASVGTITNFGTIDVALSAIEIDGSLNLLTNSGLITAESGQAVVVQDNATIDNESSGSISLTSIGIALYIQGTALIDNQGLVSGGTTSTYQPAIIAGGPQSTITNSGTIENQAGGFAIGFQSTGGTLVIDPGSSIIGAVTDTEGDGTLILGGTTANTVTYAQYQGFSTITFDNPQASLVADAADIAGETLTNWNGGDTLQITNVSATAVNYSNGQLTLTNAGGVVETLSLTGDNNDTLYNTGFSVTSNNDTTTITGTVTIDANSGVIDLNDGDSIIVSANGTINAGSTAIYDPGTIGNLTNSGMLLGQVVADNIGTLTNHNVISGATYGVEVSGNIGTLVNTATIGSQQLGIKAGGAANIMNTGLIFGANAAQAIYAQGQLIVTNAGSISSTSATTIYAGAAQSVITNSGTISGATAITFASSGDSLVLEQGSVINGPVYDDAFDGTLILGGTGADTQTFTAAQYIGLPTIEFDSTTATLVGSGLDLSSTHETITGVVAGDAIEVNNFAATSSSASGTLLTLTNGAATATFSITSADAFSRFDITSANGTTTILDAACYASGTRIRTARGDMAIESLREGDPLVTQSGALRAVKWIGRRTLDCDKHPHPERIWPICVTAHAFGPDLPQRDLWLSPAHAIAVDDGLIAAILLVNGVTIRQHRRKTITYYHVELETHDIILAENLPAESYLDTGNRAAFENAGLPPELHPDFRPRATRDFCRPLRHEGPDIDRARAALMQRARQMGYTQTHAPDLHVMADGERIDPITLPEERLAFCLPEAAREITLHSRSFIPAACGQNADRRTLGMCLREVQIDGMPVSLDNDHIFQHGWHPHETNHANDAGWRWTDGEAFIPPSTRLLVIQVNSVGRYWVEMPLERKEAVLF
jgi:hypothetical protein